MKNIGEFGATLIEKGNDVIGKRVDIAGDELTGEATAAILSKASGRQIDYAGFDPEYLRKDSEDMYTMYKWFNDVGYIADIKGLQQDYPEVGWQTLEAWANAQDWSILE